MKNKELIRKIKKWDFREHAIQRMFERKITYEEVKEVIKSGEIIEKYPEDKPYPSMLIMGKIKERVLHVVIAVNERESKGIVITVYEPSPLLWEDNFKRRRKRK